MDDSLFKASVVDFSLLPKMSKEAQERAQLENGEVTSMDFSYPLFRAPGESPEWNVWVYRRDGEKIESKTVVFDAKGKFKRIF